MTMTTHLTTLAEAAALVADGEVSATELAETHIERIRLLDVDFGAVLEVNPDALQIAEALDKEFRADGPRGPLHGVPVMVKDNLDTGDRMPTSAGSLALAGTHAAQDSGVVARLRTAGAVLLGKTNLSEWANFRSPMSSSGWSSRGGQARNAHDRLRTPGGSSSGSGVAVALGYCVGAIGTETDGSIVSPSAMNGIVGIKPTVGLVSRAGIVPISASQDTAGPMTRTVRDGALMLTALVGADPRDAATAGADTRAIDFAADLDTATLVGKRIGVARSYTGYHPGADACLEAALDALRDAGATVVDEVALTPPEIIRPFERVVMETEFKAGLQAYLATRPAGQTIATLDELIAFNDAYADTVLAHFGQEILEASAKRSGLDDPEYLEARRQCLRLTREEGIDAALGKHRLDALVAPTTSPAWLIDWIDGDNRKGGCACPPAVAGYPHVTVPMGFVKHLPVGLSFIGRAFADAKVIALAHAFECHTRARRAPESSRVAVTDR